MLAKAPAWITAAFFLLAALWILVAAIPAYTAWSRTRNHCAERRRHFTALENAANLLSPQERAAAITEAMRIQDAPEPPAPESSPPATGDQSNNR